MDREYSYIIYGASGFTGQFVIEHLARSLKEKPNVKWAVAGRNEAKIQKALAESGKVVDIDLSKTPIIIADASNFDSVVKMAKRGKVVLNCVGPYCLYGEPVVKACAENGCSHVDISGEPEFLESMQARYDAVAKQNHCYIVGACGWDSIPSDLGVDFLIKGAKGQAINTIETFADMKPGPEGYKINSGTYQTLLLGIAHREDLKAVRKQIMPERMPVIEPNIEKRSMLFKPSNIAAADSIASKWALTFMGSDRSVIMRSLYSKWKNDKLNPPNVHCYLVQNSIFTVILMAIWWMFVLIGTKVGFVLRFLQNHVDLCTAGYFSVDGPSRAQIKTMRFTYWLVAHMQDLSKEPRVVRVDGPDPGYTSTSGCLVASAMSIVEDWDDLPESGGVYTSALAFGNTKIHDRLAEFGLTFKEVK